MPCSPSLIGFWGLTSGCNTIKWLSLEQDLNAFLYKVTFDISE